jgi:hypothetical protein
MAGKKQERKQFQDPPGAEEADAFLTKMSVKLPSSFRGEVNIGLVYSTKKIE